MTRQIQIRRGTSAEHEIFTGAIGEVTMDTDVKTLRVHDGETVGGTALARAADIPPPVQLPDIDFAALAALAGQLANADYVTKQSAPGANPWFRRYKSGWVEQGGTITAGVWGDNTIRTMSLPIPMANANYNCSVTGNDVTTSTANMGGQWVTTGSGWRANRTATNFQYQSVPGGTWEVKGFAA